MKMDFKLESRQLIWDYLLLTVGALLTAFAFAAFFVTNDIAPGGVTAPKTATGPARTIALIGTGRQARSRAGSPASPGRGSMSLT